MTVSRHLSYAVLTWLFLCCSFARAEPRCGETVASVVSMQGNVDLRSKDSEAWRPVNADERICAGDSISVRRYSRALLRLELEQTNIQLGEGTTLTLPGTKDGAFSVVELLKGITHFISRVPHALKVKTPFVNAAVEGTEFIVKVDDQQALVSVSEGHVNADNAAGKLTLHSGQSAMTIRDAAPSMYTVTDTMGAVQWALYYPHVFEFEPKDITNFGLDPWRAIVADSVRALRANDLRTALTLLEQAGEDITSTRYLLYRAHLLLRVGRVAEAQEDIERVLDLDATSSVAWVMRAVIAVTQGRAKVALEAAKKAVQADTQSAPAQLALSYAYQAQFDLDNALMAALTAARIDENSALAWARVAELHLMHGRLDETLEAALRAEKLDPKSAQAKTVLGFAYLMQLRTDQAAIAFDHAAHLDPAAPLPRLGLGLVQARRGDLPGARAQIEIATSLDPRASLLRSYVGKSYYEEKRELLAEQQFNFAKELDPNDPTPWFYSAILKQTQNRPVEALRDLQKSVELNDNRAVYRSRLLLDEDLAARSASLARVYGVLGFEQLALAEAYRSVNTDPGSFSAHRFLAETYATLPRHEVARTSELLQLRLLQPLDSNPISPQLAESGSVLPEGEGLARSGLNEYNALFVDSGARVAFNSTLGGHETLAENLAATFLGQRMALGLGQSHLETAGFRANNDQQRDLRNVLLQARVSDKVHMFSEYRSESRSNGDNLRRFDPEDFRPDYREQESGRRVWLGMNYSPQVNETLLLSAAYIDTQIIQNDAYPDYASTTHDRSESKDAVVELQYRSVSEQTQWIVGIANFFADTSSLLSVDYGGPCPFETGCEITEDNIEHHFSSYVYWHSNVFRDLTATLGLGLEDLAGTDRYQMNPKGGMVWRVTPDSTLRFARFRTYERLLLKNQTIEPTQIAGFNQLFDDSGNDTGAIRSGVGFDHRLSTNSFLGLEWARRKLKFSYFDPLLAQDVEAAWEDETARAYLYGVLARVLALGVEYRYERLDRDENFVINEIVKSTSQLIPLRAKLFFANRLAMDLTATFCNQQGTFKQTRDQFAAPYQGESKFWVWDAAMSFTLPQRYGAFVAELKNLLDENVELYETDPARPRLFARRTFLVTIKLSL